MSEQQLNSPSITFVIGAGASKEVNMPMGVELKASIARALAFKVDFNTLTGGDSVIREALSQLARSREGRGGLNDYVRASLLISSAMPQAPSIDNFIDSHRSNPLVAECGKLAIAAEILRAERRSLLYVDPASTRNKLKFDQLPETWFGRFWELLTQNANLEGLPERLSKVRIVTFNYDRTVEHYLYWSLQNYYDVKPNEAAELLARLIILHPYGTVGCLPWQQARLDLQVPFGGELGSGGLLKVASGIRTFTEGTDTESSHIELIRSSIWDATRLVFLGFAFHELNLQVLYGQGRDTPRRYDHEVYGSALGVSESNKNAIVGELRDIGRYDRDQIALRRELTAAQVLLEYSRRLRI